MKRLDAPKIDWAADTEWESKTGCFPRYPSQVETFSFSRPFLESTIFSFLSKKTNVSFHHSHAEGLLGNDFRPCGLRCLDRSEHFADLIVLAGGQHFPLSRFVGAAVEPKTESLPVHITYRSVLLERGSLSLDGFKQYYYQINPPADPIGAVICPIEHGRAIATIIEYGSRSPVKVTFDAFMDLAARVPGCRFSSLLKEATPIGKVSAFHKATMYLRRLDRVKNFPENVFCVGDIFCSLNPVFGQGMTAALIQATLLDQCLQVRRPSSTAFHGKSSAHLRLPFVLSKTGSTTRGGLSKNYFDAFVLRCQRSKTLHRNFLNVLHLERSYGALFDFKTVGSTLFGSRGVQ